MQDMMMEHMTKSDERFKTLESIVLNLVTFMFQRTQGALPSQTKPNPKEDQKVVSTRSEKPHAEYKKKEKATSAEKDKEVLTEEGPIKDKKALTDSS